MFPDDWALCRYHAVGVTKYRVVIHVMTHQTLSLEKYWKLFSATLTLSPPVVTYRFYSV